MGMPSPSPLVRGLARKTNGERRVFKNELRQALRRRALGIPQPTQAEVLLLWLTWLHRHDRDGARRLRHGRRAPSCGSLWRVSIVARRRFAKRLIAASTRCSWSFPGAIYISQILDGP